MYAIWFYGCFVIILYVVSIFSAITTHNNSDFILGIYSSFKHPFSILN